MEDFNKKIIRLGNLFDTNEELINFLIEKKAFNENFAKTVIETKKIKLLKKDLTIDYINQNLQYNVSYSDDKVLVDITTNNTFSYLDTEQELKYKMRNYIRTEQYDKAELLKNYFNTIDLKFIA